MLLMRSIVVAIIMLCHSFPVYSQLKSRTISGSVADKETGIRLAGVSISSTRHGYGTLSNKDGQFILNLPGTSGPDTLQLSMLGYKTQVIPFDQKNRAVGRVILEPTATTLSEVVIIAIDPVSIIKEAIRKIPDNYLSEGHVQQGFYRTATRKGREYIQLSEAAFDIFNYGYGKNKQGQLKLKKMRALKDEKESHGIDLGLKPHILFGFDMVNEISHNPVLSKEGLKKHRFLLKDIVDYEGQEAYEITFDQKEGQKEALYKGSLYILKEKQVIVAINYGLSPKGIRYARYGDLATRALMKLLDMSVQIKKDEVRARYRQSGSRWVLSDVKNNTILQFRSSRKQYDFEADVLVDFVTTGIDTFTKTPFSEKLVLGDNKFIEHVEAEPDTAFWKEQNIILPDFPVEEVIRKIKAANETHNLKKSAVQYLRKLPRSNIANIDSIVSFYAQRGQFNGTALIVHQGEVVLDKSYGMADKDKMSTADKHTGYRIGSLSKPFTALVIQQLAAEGKLGIDAPVGTYLPGYAHPEITIAQLLSHTSGLPNCTNNPGYLSVLMHDPLPLKDIVTRFCSDSLEFESGTRFAYSNSGYLLLAHIAATIEQKDFERILQERIFTLLHMTASYLGWQPQARPAATAYLYGQKEPDYPVTNMTGAGGITTTAYDLWLFNKGLLKGTLFPDPILQAMYIPKADYTDWGADYGYGWMIDKLQFAVSGKSKIIYHPGTDMGFYSMFAKKDDTESLVILLSNTGDFPRFDLTDLLLTALNDQ